MQTARADATRRAPPTIALAVIQRRNLQRASGPATGLAMRRQDETLWSRRLARRALRWKRPPFLLSLLTISPLRSQRRFLPQPSPHPTGLFFTNGSGAELFRRKLGIFRGPMTAATRFARKPKKDSRTVAWGDHGPGFSFAVAVRLGRGGDLGVCHSRHRDVGKSLPTPVAGRLHPYQAGGAAVLHEAHERG